MTEEPFCHRERDVGRDHFPLEMTNLAFGQARHGRSGANGVDGHLGHGCLLVLCARGERLSSASFMLRFLSPNRRTRLLKRDILPIMTVQQPTDSALLYHDYHKDHKPFEGEKTCLRARDPIDIVLQRSKHLATTLTPRRPLSTPSLPTQNGSLAKGCPTSRQQRTSAPRRLSALSTPLRSTTRA